jgi:hypothetical protein
VIGWINTEDWLVGEETAAPGMPGQPPTTSPGGPGDPMGQGPTPPTPDPNAVPAQPLPQPQAPEQLNDDPEHPDMPEDDESPKDFETWRMDYLKQSIKANPQELMDLLIQVRDKVVEDPNPNKFVADNMQICGVRSIQDVLKPSQEIRKHIKDELDRNNPARSLVSYIADVADKYPILAEFYLKLSGSSGAKGDWHRKYVAALLGAVQVGSGGANEDLIYAEKDFSILISTRFASKWGDIQLGRWSLREDDPQRYLKDAELQRLESGSPEEKDVLRRRVIMESIAEFYRGRAFIINVVGSDGTVQHLGLDLGNCVKAAYLDGKLVCRTESSDALDAFIDENGDVVPIPHLSIKYVKESGHGTMDAEEEDEELTFLEQRDGSLYLVASLDLIKETSTALQGMVYKETLFQGNPTDVMRLIRCTPGLSEVILRQCN